MRGQTYLLNDESTVAVLKITSTFTNIVIAEWCPLVVNKVKQFHFYRLENRLSCNSRFVYVVPFTCSAKGTQNQRRPLPHVYIFALYACAHTHENKHITCTVMILSFRTDMPGQTVQTQIRRLLEEQSDQGLHCLLFRLHRLDSFLYGRATLFKF